MSWGWEYNPDEENVAAGAPPAFVIQVEQKADEIVRAAVIQAGIRLVSTMGFHFASGGIQ